MMISSCNFFAWYQALDYGWYESPSSQHFEWFNEDLEIQSWFWMLYDSMRILDAKTNKGISWLEHESCQEFKEARNELKLKEVIGSLFV